MSPNEFDAYTQSMFLWLALLAGTNVSMCLFGLVLAWLIWRRLNYTWGTFRHTLKEWNRNEPFLFFSPFVFMAMSVLCVTLLAMPTLVLRQESREALLTCSVFFMIAAMVFVIWQAIHRHRFLRQRLPQLGGLLLAWNILITVNFLAVGFISMAGIYFIFLVRELALRS